MIRLVWPGCHSEWPGAGPGTASVAPYGLRQGRAALRAISRAQGYGEFLNGRRAGPRGAPERTDTLSAPLLMLPTETIALQ
jgi:hypothetical protein